MTQTQEISLGTSFGAAAPSPVQAAPPEIGDEMPDGTRYAGLSPDTQKPMYTTPEDAPSAMNFLEAQVGAAKLEACGHHDWRVPSKKELKLLLDFRDAIGGFNGPGRDGWHTSSTEFHLGMVWGASFGYEDHLQLESRKTRAAVRFVR